MGYGPTGQTSVFSTRRIGSGTETEMSEERTTDQPFLPDGGYRNYIDSIDFNSEILKNPSLSNLARFNATRPEKFEPNYTNVKSYFEKYEGEVIENRYASTLETDLDTANGQFNPEDMLEDAPESTVFGTARSISSTTGYSLSLGKLGYNPFTYQSNKEITIGDLLQIDPGQEAKVSWISSYGLYKGTRGNIALFQKYKDPFGDESTTEFFEDSLGFTRFKSAEYEEDLENIDLNPDNANEFNPVTYFNDNPNYKVLFKTVQDFRKLKSDVLGDEYAQPFTDYAGVTNRGKRFHREVRVNTGNPGKRLAGTKGVNIRGRETTSYDMFDEDTIDKINALDIFRQEDNMFETAEARDLIRFRIEALDADDPSKSNTMIFRAFLDSFGDNYTGEWNGFKYNGRAEKFYTYAGFDRKLTFSFKIAAQSRHEMVPLYRKLNYLVSQTAPEYGNTRMRGSFCRLTIGSMIDRTPGFFTAIGLKWNKEYPWDISINHLENGEDKDGSMIMPHILDVNCSFTPIHNFIPKKSVKDSPFILSHHNNRSLQKAQKWYSYEPPEGAGAMTKAYLQNKRELY